MNEHLFYVGITHESAPLAIRESVRPDADKRRAMLERIATIARGRMVLATCERFELYATTACTDAGAWAKSLAHWFQLPAGLVAAHVQMLHGAGVARHLLRVAAGLESRIVGEPQILGQVREAFLMAESAGALDAELNALGRAAIRAGKRVRHETTLNAEARSISAIALDQLSREPGALYERSVLIVGTGNLASVVAEDLRRRRVGRLLMAGRNEERLAVLAAKIAAASYHMEQLPEAIAGSDAVIACTSAPSHVIYPATIGRDRPTPLFILDLSVPRNVDPAVTRLPSVHLRDLDELVSSQPIRLDGIAAAGAILEDELSRFLRWKGDRRAAPVIAATMASAVRPAGPAERRALHQLIARLKEEAAA